MYYTVGVVAYTPSMGLDMSDPYELGDAVPIITGYQKRYSLERHEYWIENNIEYLKTGNTVIINWMENKMYRIKYIEGLGVRVVDEEGCIL